MYICKNLKKKKQLKFIFLTLFTNFKNNFF